MYAYTDFDRQFLRTRAAQYRDQLERNLRGELADPTLTPQLRSGFVVRGILWHYLDDAEHGSEASLIVWENPEL